MTDKKMKIIWGVNNRKGHEFWTRIGIAFINQDDSENLLFDYYPTDPNTRVQVRKRAPKGADVDEDSRDHADERHAD